MSFPSSSRRFAFGDFALSLSRRVLIRGGREVPLIPRYFDLLVLLVSRREEAIARREILEAVWTDVVVSDGALSQAVRTLRRALEDDPRNPRYIRTVSRYGYQFVFAEVREEDDSAPIAQDPCPSSTDDVDAVWERFVDERGTEDARREAAERLHQLGTGAAVRRLDEGPPRPQARALLRDARWDVPDSGPVPIFGRPGALRGLLTLFALRLRRVLRVAGRRWVASMLGAALAGLFAGLVGGLALYAGPGSEATHLVLLLLPLVGIVIGATGAFGVAAGLCCAEVWVRSYRGVALVLFGGAGGFAVGLLAHGVGALVLEGLFGTDLSPAAGGFEGAVLGAATGLGYALATPRPAGGMATPHRGARWTAALSAGLCCAVAAAVLTRTGSYLGAMSLDFLAHSFPGSQVSLTPLARLFGETTPGPWTKLAVGFWEGLTFAGGTVLGLTHRPK